MGNPLSGASPWQHRIASSAVGSSGGVTLHAIFIFVFFVFACFHLLQQPCNLTTCARTYARACWVVARACSSACAAHRKKLKIKLSHRTAYREKLGIWTKFFCGSSLALCCIKFKYDYKFVGGGRCGKLFKLDLYYYDYVPRNVSARRAWVRVSLSQSVLTRLKQMQCRFMDGR